LLEARGLPRLFVLNPLCSDWSDFKTYALRPQGVGG
jgi:hypothetical protein